MMRSVLVSVNLYMLVYGICLVVMFLLRVFFSWKRNVRIVSDVLICVYKCWGGCCRVVLVLGIFLVSFLDEDVGLCLLMVVNFCMGMVIGVVLCCVRLMVYVVNVRR